MGPVIAFFITRRWCISLQRADNEPLLHGHETRRDHARPPRVVHREAPAARRSTRPTRSPRVTATRSCRCPSRGRRERRRQPQGQGDAAARAAVAVLVRRTTSRSRRARSSRRPTTTPSTSWRSTRTGTSTSPRTSYKGDYELDGQPADGHQFDGRHGIEGDELRKP